MLHTIQNDALTVSRDGAQYLQQPRALPRHRPNLGARRSIRASGPDQIHIRHSPTVLHQCLGSRKG